MKKKKLYILTPSDRFNYGDMLFPYIIMHYLGSAVDSVVNCATTASDLSERGGMPTVGFEGLFEASDGTDNFLIVGGGESLFATWPGILSFIYEDVEKKVKEISSLPQIPVIRRMYYKYLEHYVKGHYSVKTAYPFTIGLDELPRFKAIMYNSVGSCCLSDRQDLIRSRRCKKILGSSAYLSVRDQGTSKGLMKMGIPHHLFPDSAILISEVFSDAFLKDKMTGQGICPYKTGDYIFFQINMRSAKGNERFWVEVITGVYWRLKKKFVLCPIGTALGHSDDLALNSICRLLPRECYWMADSPNIWDIMYLIKNSCLYVGTSLHGAITAMSFSVPMVTHGKTKVKQYLTDWGGGLFTNINHVEQDIIKQLTNPVISSSAMQKELALRSMNNMRAIMESRR